MSLISLSGEGENTNIGSVADKRHLKDKMLDRMVPEFHMREYVKQRCLNESGDAVITLRGDRKSIFSPFCVDGKECIDPSAIVYIDECAYEIPVYYDIVIDILENDFSEENRDRIARSIQEHYILAFEDKKEDMRINAFISVSLLCMGIFLLGLSFFLNSIDANRFITEFFSVAATFSLWETVDCFLIKRNQLDVEKMNARQLAVASICNRRIKQNNAMFDA